MNVSDSAEAHPLTGAGVRGSVSVAGSAALRITALSTGFLRGFLRSSGFPVDGLQVF